MEVFLSQVARARAFLRREGIAPLWVSCLVLVSVASCSSNSDAGEGLPAPVDSGSWERPALGVTWNWQLQGTLDEGVAAEIYDIDLFETSETTIARLQAAGIQVLCYFSAGSFEAWRPDASAFPSAVLGATLDGFEDERWLDIRAESLRGIMRGRMDLAKAKGCDGVEPDNVDGYTNSSGFDLTGNAQLVFNTWLANEAHSRGLFIALKNDGDQIAELLPFFDLALNEQCHEFEGDCEPLALFIAAGKPVLNAEYEARLVTDSAARASLCAGARAESFSTLILPLELDGSFRIEC